MSLHGICGIMDTNPQYTIRNRARTSSIRYAIFNTHRLPRSKQRLIYAPNQRLTQQLKDLSIPFTDDFGSAIKDTDHIVDAIFGKPTPLHRTTVSRNAVTLALSGVKRVIATPETLNPPKLISIFAHYFTNKTKQKIGFSFSGEVREPFPAVITAMRDAGIPVLSVDAPSSWNIETGPPADGPGKGFHPESLISLTAPKPLVDWFKGRHFVGGR